jgi:hypothetical protein
MSADRGNFHRMAAGAAAFLLLGVPIAALADRASDVAALEARCEKEREAQIKPLRDAKIAQCKAEGRNDPGYCERFWSDYGNAVRRPNGTMTPRMFDDLPVCLEAFKARRDLNRDGS